MKRIGGSFNIQNKQLPGFYVKLSGRKPMTATLGGRGIVAIAMPLNWGNPGITEIDRGDIVLDKSILGYNYTDEEMLNIRELFKHAKTALIFNLNGNAVKAKTTIGTEAPIKVEALKAGVKGNVIQVAIEELVDTEGYLIKTIVDGDIVDKQEADNIEDIKENKWVEFSGTGALAAEHKTAGVYLTAGDNGTAASHTDFLTELEQHSYNILAYPGTDAPTKRLYVAFAERMAEEGIYMQLVGESLEADSYNVISVANKTEEENGTLVYWVAGLQAGLTPGESATSKNYNGEYVINTNYSRKEIETMLELGQFVFWGREPYVVEDINTFRSFTQDLTKDFRNNQIVRIIHQRITDIEKIFVTEFMGRVQNIEENRTLFWHRLAKHGEAMQAEGYIVNYNGEEDTIVTEGKNKEDVVVRDAIQAAVAITKIYMYVEVA